MQVESGKNVRMLLINLLFCKQQQQMENMKMILKTTVIRKMVIKIKHTEFVVVCALPWLYQRVTMVIKYLSGDHFKTC